jgi:hypothetical protein
MSGTLLSTHLSFVRTVAQMIGNTAFFEPATAKMPDKGLPPLILNDDIPKNYSTHDEYDKPR